MLKIRKPIMAVDEVGDEVLMAKGDTISEISDAGPIESFVETGVAGQLAGFPIGWNVTVRVTPTHSLWSELVTVDAVALLKALEG